MPLDDEVTLSDFDRMALEAFRDLITKFLNEPTRRNGRAVSRAMYYVRSFITLR